MQVHHACKRMTLRPSNFAFEPDTRPTDNVLFGIAESEKAMSNTCLLFGQHSAGGGGLIPRLKMPPSVALDNDLA
jgi:hypothetical protein